MIIDMHAHSDPRLGVESVGRIREQCRRNGVGLLVLSSLGRWSPAPDPQEIRDANDEARACAARSDGLIRWLVYLNPQNEDWPSELDRGLQNGAVGVKLWIALRDKDGGLKHTTAVIRAASVKKMPVLIHTFHRVEHNLPGEVSLDEVGLLARRFPKATLIAAHAGAHWRQCLDVLRRFPRNALVDISGCIPEQGMLEALVDGMGAGRILFGSDLLGRSQASQLAKVELAGLPSHVRAAILGDNARRVFGLGSLAPVRASGPRVRLRLPDARTDHFCFCGAWPFFLTPARTPRALNRLLAKARMVKAYTGDLGGVYRLDLANANREFITACRGAGRVAPLAVLNPRDFNWPDVLEQLSPAFAGVILYPYLHNWQLDDPAQAACFKALSAKRIPVWINVLLGDSRFRHAGLACRPVAPAELAGFARTAPPNAYVVQGASAGHMGDTLKHLSARRRFRFEISRLTDVSGALAKTLREFGAASLVMGSEFPLRDLREVRWVAERERVVSES
jgi:predicted TIM-barrel fold metal-dependent hydrolase